MDRKEFLNEFFRLADDRFAVNLKKSKEGVLFALACLRNKKTAEEAVQELKDTYNLIEV